MEQPDPLNEKLYRFRNIEDKPNRQALEAYRALQEKLEKYEWFIGVAPSGSVTRGYNLEVSDIDGKIIYDSSKLYHQPNPSHLFSFPTEVVDPLKEYSEEIEES